MQYLLWLYTSAGISHPLQKSPIVDIRVALVQNSVNQITDAQLNDVYAQARLKAAAAVGLTNVTLAMQQIMQSSNEQSFLHFYRY